MAVTAAPCAWLGCDLLEVGEFWLVWLGLDEERFGWVWGGKKKMNCFICFVLYFFVLFNMKYLKLAFSIVLHIYHYL